MAIPGTLYRKLVANSAMDWLPEYWEFFEQTVQYDVKYVVWHVQAAGALLSRPEDAQGMPIILAQPFM